MKRVLAVLLIVALCLGVCACQEGGAAVEEKKEFRVGFGRTNLTPSYSVPLAGYGLTSNRMSQGYLDYIYATCIAATDENDSTVLIVTTDIIAVENHIIDPLRKAVTEATGVPADRILIQGTHTHSAPDLLSKESSAAKYQQEYIELIAEACADAMADRSPATMYTAEAHLEGMNFVRHYTVSDGTVYGDNFGSLAKGTLNGHTSEADNQLQMILFKREAADKKNIVSINWQGHAKMASTAETSFGTERRSMISADFIGPARDYVEANADCLFSFHLGASGNLNVWSKIASENFTDDHKVYGEKLGRYVVEALKDAKPVEDTAIMSTQQIYEAPIDKSDDHLLEAAQKVYSVWSATNNYDQAVAAAPDSGVISPHHAGSIISRYNNTEGTRKFELNAVSIGSVGFITAPYEMFDMNGMFIKENSPFETTFVMTCANGGNNYLAAEHAFTFNNGTGSYEVHNRTFPRGTAEDLADTYVEMLKELKK